MKYKILFLIAVFAFLGCAYLGYCAGRALGDAEMAAIRSEGGVMLGRDVIAARWGYPIGGALAGFFLPLGIASFMKRQGWLP